MFYSNVSKPTRINNTWRLTYEKCSSEINDQPFPCGFKGVPDKNEIYAMYVSWREGPNSKKDNDCF